MPMVNPARPNLKKLIADNTIQFLPNTNVILTNQEFETVINAFVKVKHSDWYIDHQEYDMYQNIIDCWLRLKSHRLVCLRLEQSGTISTVFMKTPTAHKIAATIMTLVNQSLSQH